MVTPKHLLLPQDQMSSIICSGCSFLPWSIFPPGNTDTLIEGGNDLLLLEPAENTCRQCLRYHERQDNGIRSKEFFYLSVVHFGRMHPQPDGIDAELERRNCGTDRPRWTAFFFKVCFLFVVCVSFMVAPTIFPLTFTIFYCWLLWKK